MKASKLAALALAAVLFPALAFAQQDANAAKPTQQSMSIEQFDQEMAKAQENLKNMQEQMSLIQKAADPAQRQKLMQQHQVMMVSERASHLAGGYPVVRQQLGQGAGLLRRQAREHVLQVGVRIVPVQAG
ncbi:hypothetical protein Q058_00520 [Pseudomonas aeruginosa BL04]|nr:hypothetical protein Q058_00520 [Pseudomonas aeruginosa BL04]